MNGFYALPSGFIDYANYKLTVNTRNDYLIGNYYIQIVASNT